MHRPTLIKRTFARPPPAMLKSFRRLCAGDGSLVLGGFVDAGAVDGEASLARHRVGDVAEERALALRVAPRERVQMRLRLQRTPHAHIGLAPYTDTTAV